MAEAHCSVPSNRRVLLLSVAGPVDFDLKDFGYEFGFRDSAFGWVRPIRQWTRHSAAGGHQSAAENWPEPG